MGKVIILLYNIWNNALNKLWKKKSKISELFRFSFFQDERHSKQRNEVN